MDDLQLLFDREQHKPLNIMVGVNKNIITTRGLLQGYSLDQKADYRLVKTFNGDNFFYFFGEAAPALQLRVIMSDGALYNIEDKKFNYVIDILDFVQKGHLLYGKNVNELEIQPATISFNRLVVNGYIVNVAINGNAQTPGTASANIQVIVKKISISKPFKKEKSVTITDNTMFVQNFTINKFGEKHEKP